MRNPVPYMGATNRGPGNRIDPRFVSAYETMEQPPEFEFYVLRDDPFELVNRIGDAGHGKTIAELKEKLLAWRQASPDPLLDPDEFARLLKAHEEKK